MSSSLILIIFFCFLTAQFLCEWVLIRLNISFAWTHRNEIPDFLVGKIDSAELTRSVEYLIQKSRLTIIETTFSALLLAVLVSIGAFGWFDTWLRDLGLEGIILGIVYVLGISFFFSLLDLPFSWYKTFVIEEKFGFNKTSHLLWATDFAKGLVLGAMLGALVVGMLLWMMQHMNSFWWVYAWAFLTSIQLLLTYVYPIWIAPLFHKFTPLPEGALREQIYQLASTCGFHLSGLFVVNGSKRSAHANAYFTGIGNQKRIVLYDTLIAQLSEKEVLAVLAHEIGHEKKKHLTKMLIFSTVLSGIAFFVLGQLLQFQPFFTAFGFSSLSHHGALVIFSFAFGPLLYFFSPLSSILSRRYEYEADRFAVDAVSGASDLTGALIALHCKSLGNPRPHPAYSFFHYSHPTLSERIAAMKHYGSTKLS